MIGCKLYFANQFAQPQANAAWQWLVFVIVIAAGKNACRDQPIGDDAQKRISVFSMAAAKSIFTPAVNESVIEMGTRSISFI